MSVLTARHLVTKCCQVATQHMALRLLRRSWTVHIFQDGATRAHSVRKHQFADDLIRLCFFLGGAEISAWSSVSALNGSGTLAALTAGSGVPSSTGGLAKAASSSKPIEVASSDVLTELNLGKPGCGCCESPFENISKAAMLIIGLASR